MAMIDTITAMASWANFVGLPRPDASTEFDREVRYSLSSHIPVIVFDKLSGCRRAILMRWGFPDPNCQNRVKHVNARSERVVTAPAFADAFCLGQRGIVLMENSKEVRRKTTHQRMFKVEETTLAAAFVWRQFASFDSPTPSTACVMITVPAGKLGTAGPSVRMPAFLAQRDWGKWLGEETCTIGEVKDCLRAVGGAGVTTYKLVHVPGKKRRVKLPQKSESP